MTFVPDYPVAGLTGAEYNPRTITPEDEAALRESILSLGFCKPVLVTESGRLVAGHQRTTQARALGLTTVPAYVLQDLKLASEMRFNQLHNASDIDSVPVDVRVGPQARTGFVEVVWQDIEGDPKQPGAPVRAEIQKLMAQYGPWGCAIATQDGEVVSSGQYALTCRTAKRPLRAFVMPDAKRDLVRCYFGREYGVFAYDKLPRTTFVQTYAQLRRAAQGKESATYRMVRPKLRRSDRILDFGCGYGDAMRDLKADGYDVLGVEFFYRGQNGYDTIKPGEVHAMVDAVCASLRTRGRFDVVICDSVLNSVDSLQAEADVLTCVNAFCKPGGLIAFSGLGRERSERSARASSAVSASASGRKVQFLDGNGFSALPRGDLWFFQKFHTREQVREFATRYIGTDVKLEHGLAWRALGSKSVDLDPNRVRDAIAREFDLPWPGGRTVGRSAAALEAYNAATA